jgi:hypothetical protein
MVPRHGDAGPLGLENKIEPNEVCPNRSYELGLANQVEPNRLNDKVQWPLNLLRGAFPSESPPAWFWLTLLFQAGGAHLISSQTKTFCIGLVVSF